MEEYYNYLHKYPELSGFENETSLYVTRILKQYSCILYYNDLSIIAFFDKGKNDAIALRSELDALPIIEDENHVIKSQNEFMHACGHDVHTSCLLKLASYIEITNFNHNIALIFQAKEESGLGAKSIVESGILKDLKIKKIIAMHVWPNLKDNTVFSAKNLMFGSYELDVIINGENNHISTYNKKTDATFASYKLYKKLYKNNRNFIYHLGELKSGNLRNISSNKAVLKYSIRFKNNNRIKEKIEGINIYTSCKIKYNFLNYFPPLINSNELLNQFKYRKIKTLKSAEDFGYYSTACKTLYLLYGLGKGKSLHTSGFAVTKKQRINYYKTMLNILNSFK